MIEKKDMQDVAEAMNALNISADAQGLIALLWPTADQIIEELSGIHEELHRIREMREQDRMGV